MLGSVGKAASLGSAHMSAANLQTWSSLELRRSSFASCSSSTSTSRPHISSNRSPSLHRCRSQHRPFSSTASPSSRAFTNIHPSISHQHKCTATAAVEQAPPTSPDNEPNTLDRFYEATFIPLLDRQFCPITHNKTDEELHLLAQEWGYTKIGQQFPGGATARILSETLTGDAFRHKPWQLPLALLKGIGVYAACAAIMHNAPSFLSTLLTPVLWGLMGTAYAGLFSVASHCAHFSPLPSSNTLLLQDLIGAALMAPALYPFVTWRAQFVGHVLRPCTLDFDSRVWRPMTTDEYAALPQRAAMLTRLVHGTPLKLLASIGHWFHSFDGFDLKPYYKDNRGGMLAGWIAPALFVGFALPQLITQVGFSGLFSYYLAPLAVFHFWLSTLTLVAHRGPHIPWNAYGPEWDEGQTIVNGTVTLKLPRWIEFLLNDANYHLPNHVSIYIPWYNLRTAYDQMQGALGVYLSEADLNLRLLSNLITKWQLFDVEKQSYVPFPSPLVTEEDQAEIEARLEQVLPKEAREKLGQQLEEGAKQVLTKENKALVQRLLDGVVGAVSKAVDAVSPLVAKLTTK